MSAPAVKRDEMGRIVAGSACMNPGGRPRGVIEDVRERLGPYTPEFCAALVELVRSPNELTRLSAIREFFDRLLGKPPVAVDTTVTKVNIGELYLQAMQLVNHQHREAAIDVTPGEPGANATDRADTW